MNEAIRNHFLNRLDVNALLELYGSPLYVYHESVLRERIRDVKGLCDEPWFGVNVSIKANANPALLSIVREEGCNGDAVSPGEIFLLEKAGFDPSQIVFVSNNVSSDEMRYALDRGVLVSVDSLSQLETLGRINRGGRVCLRFNPGAGAGHHEKVITAGTKTKFGIQNNMINQAKAIANQYDMRIVGLNQHIGSLFMENKPYLDGVRALLDIAREFGALEFVDFGGGFGIPYRRYHGEDRMDLAGLSQALKTIVTQWMKDTGRKIRVKVEPGRYIFAECGVLLGTVHAVKSNYDRCYIGTDIGFNVLLRSAMYDAYHELALFRNGRLLQDGVMTEATVVGNICETGDILARDRLLPAAREGDVLAVLDAGAYGYSMSSNYNQRLRPAEVLITSDGKDRLIRRRDRFEDLLSGIV